MEYDSPFFVEDDGGRAQAGYKAGNVGDCVVRAIAIATRGDYKTIYKALSRKGSSARNGVLPEIYDTYLKENGWEWVSCMKDKHKRVHLNDYELPLRGRLILRLSKHVTAWIDGKLYDNYDCSRGGKRMVYGYYRKKQ
jgi:hypothetical protein